MLLPIVPPEFSGAGKRGWRMAQGFADLGVDIKVLTYTSHPVERVPRSFDVSVVNTWRTWRRDGALRAVPRPLRTAAAAVATPVVIARHLRGFRADLVYHLGCDLGPQLAGVAAVFVNRPFIAEATLMGSDDASAVRGARLGALRFALLRRAAMVVNISPRLEASALRAGLPRDRVCVIPNDVDIAKFQPASDSERQDLRTRLGLGKGNPLIVTIGSVVQRKGIVELTREFARAVLPAFPSARLVIVGPVPTHPEAQAYVAELARETSRQALRDHVALVGEVSDTSPYLRAADLFAFASREEGFGSVIAEAMACGVPIVMRRIEGISEFILGNVEASAVVDNDADMGPAIVQLLGSSTTPGVRAALRTRAVEAFSQSVVYGRYVELFESILTRAPVAGVRSARDEHSGRGS